MDNKKLLWTYAGVTSATGGTVYKPFDIYGVSIDSRSVEKGDLFVALKADRDGHYFIKNAMQRGAAAALAVWKPKNLPADFPVVYVKNTLHALRAIAAASRVRSQAKIVGVTGSAGKTTVKEILKFVLERQGTTHAAEKSYNNHWGVPLTLSRMPADAEYGVFEMGMNKPGEIEGLTGLVRPHIAVITVIGAAHLGNFDDISGIAAEKSDIIKGVVEGGCAILNADDQFFEFLSEKAAERQLKVISFGKSERADIRLVEYDNQNGEKVRLNFSVFGQSLTFTVRLFGEHNAVNIAAVLAVLTELGISPADCAEAFADFNPPSGRGETVQLQNAKGEVYNLIDESYNANPLSMRAALGNAALVTPEKDGRKIAVIGEMRELGKESAGLHAGLADAVRDGNFYKIYLVGEATDALYEALGEEAPCVHALDIDDIMDEIMSELKKDDILFVKGSNGVRLGKLIVALKKASERVTQQASENNEEKADENVEEAASAALDADSGNDNASPEEGDDKKEADDERKVV